MYSFPIPIISQSCYHSSTPTYLPLLHSETSKLEKTVFFGVMTSRNLVCGHYENGSSMFLYNAGNHLQDYIYTVTTENLSFSHSQSST
jgi:hypothetical protein